VTPDLTVVVVTHGGRELALRTLASARAATGGAQVQWIVVDAASPDGTPEAIAAAHPDVELLRVPNRGFAAGNNAGLARARGRWVLLLNPDVEVLRGTLAGLVAALDARGDLGAAGVVQRDARGGLHRTIRRFPTAARDLGEALFATRRPVLRELQELEVRDAPYFAETEADWVVGSFLAVRRSALEQVGGLDERFFLYSEEIDLCLRLRQAGWRVVHLPVMEVLHHAGRRDSGDLAAQLAHSRLLFAAKHLPAGQRAGVRAALTLGHVLRLAALAPAAVVHGGARARARSESAGLAVLLGRGRPPLGRPSS
jgi:GT2 family glycosyltransferase